MILFYLNISQHATKRSYISTQI